MPFTQFHLGFGIFFGLLFLRYLDFPTFILANLVVDARTGAVFFDLIGGETHTWLHSYPGSLVYAALLAFPMLVLRPYINIPDQEYSASKIRNAAVAGVLLHVALDSFTHSGMHPFYPLEFKPLYGLVQVEMLEMISLLLLVVSAIYLLRETPEIKSFLSSQ